MTSRHIRTLLATGDQQELGRLLHETDVAWVKVIDGARARSCDRGISVGAKRGVETTIHPRPSAGHTWGDVGLLFDPERARFT